MINRASIQQWSENAPWIDNAQIEQDLIICRALIAIFSDDFLASQLAFRGGTALHKLYLSPQPRYSEDIDLVQINPGPIKPIMYRLGEVLDFLPDRVTKQKRYNIQCCSVSNQRYRQLLRYVLKWKSTVLSISMCLV